MKPISSFATAWRQGLIFGVALGILLSLDAVAKVWLPSWPAWVISVLSGALYLVGIAAFFFAGFRAAAVTGRVSTGLLAGLLAGLISSLISGVVTAAVSFIFVDRLREQYQILASNDTLLELAIAGIVEVLIGFPVVGLALGALGGVFGRRRGAAPPSYRVPPYPAPSASASAPDPAASYPPSDSNPRPQVWPQYVPAPHATPEPTATNDLPTVFVSHSHQDDEFCRRLVAQLRRELGGDDAVWYDASGGLHGGDEWVRKIEAELTSRSAFIVVLSPDAAQSRWVNREIEIAIHQHDTASMKIIPILARQCDIRPILRGFQYISFLPPASYDAAFQQLLLALRGS